MDQYRTGKSRNAITVDVEDYFHVSAFESRISRSDWHRYPMRVETNTRHVMDVFDEFNTKGTFFVLGWVAEKCRDLVLEIQERGHEVGCHGYAHELIYRIGPDRFRQDIHKARTVLEDICGKKIAGYRAPSFSITGEIPSGPSIFFWKRAFCTIRAYFPYGTISTGCATQNCSRTG